MSTVYRSLAWVICALVILQAASEAWFASGLGKYLLAGGTVDMSAVTGPPPFPEIFGIVIHTINGTYVIPVMAALLLIVGWLTHNRRALIMAAVVAVLVAVQVTLGLNAHLFTFLAFFHGMNALLLFGTALGAAFAFHTRRMEQDPAPATDQSRPIVGSGV
jgi:hypothetical protein